MSNRVKQGRLFCHEPQFRVAQTEGDTTQRVISGYAAVFNQNTDIGYATESIAPGAFTQTLANGDEVVALFNHDPSLPLGKTPQSLKLKEDTFGLYCEISPPDTTLGRDLITNIESGIISKMSFGFYIEKEELDQSGSKPHFTITQVRLFDVSAVTFPAYKGTQLQMERDSNQTEAEFRERLEALLPSDERNKALRAIRARSISRTKIQFSL